MFNWSLMSHPYNWIVVFLMLLIACFGWHLIAGGHAPKLPELPIAI